MAEKEYIEREAAINAICRLCSDTTRDKCSIQDICNHVCRLEAVPAADVRPVVLCRDCKYSYSSVGGWCCFHGICVDCIVREDFFCADGEKEEEQT